MSFSAFLNDRRAAAEELVNALGKDFRYASILGTDVDAVSFQANAKTASAREGECERGFVVKLHDGTAVYEYSLDDLKGDIEEIAERIKRELRTGSALSNRMIRAEILRDEPLRKDYLRETDFASFDDGTLLNVCSELSEEICKGDERVKNAFVRIGCFTADKLFISKNRMLTQSYGWANGVMMAVWQGEKMAEARKMAYGTSLASMIGEMREKIPALLDLARLLGNAKPIVPGVYDVITDPSITGLIAHEAFGHGVEMDQFVKDRALAKEYMGKPVASGIVNMHDGAAATLSAASYFFDDDGVTAQDTKIIENGILVRGLSDLTSASELGTVPTGNGRRESFRRKAYTRMTNTFFEPGQDKLEDMIASIKHGYMLFDTNNGMEDPKNWQIQCTAEYGIEIVDGRLTDHVVSPVVMSGYVPDLLKSISMISDEFVVTGAGMCGKGYKEWVRVSDGGPHLKAKVKLG